MGHEIEPGFVSDEHVLGRLNLRHGGGFERLPEPRIVFQSEERVDQGGIEPGLTSLARYLARGPRPAVLPEHLRGLGEAQHPPRQRDLIAGDPGGIAAAVPVFVDVHDRPSRNFAEPDRADDRRSSLAAQLNQRPCAGAACHQRRSGVPPSGEHRPAGAGGAKHVQHSLWGTGGIRQPSGALDDRVVNAE